MKLERQIAEIQDATDFPPPADAPGVRSLDLALRCTICSEFFDAPVTLPCGHGFCSLCLGAETMPQQCVHNAMREKAECPSCRVSAPEVSLRRNVVLEEAITAWKLARSLVLRLALDEVARNTRRMDKTPNRSNGTKRKRSRRESSDEIVELSTAPRANGRAFQHSPLKRDPGDSRRQGLVNEGEESEDEEFDHVPTSDAEEEFMSAFPHYHDTLQHDEDAFTDGSRVSCPVCGQKVELSRINRHIDDNCPTPSPRGTNNKVTNPSTKTQNKQEWSEVFGRRSKGKEKEGSVPRIDSEEADKLPRVSYHVLKEKALREMLQKLKLPSTGDKKTLIARHERYVMIYNANLDKSPQLRKSIANLRMELESWEKSRVFQKPVVEDTRAYQKAQRSTFDRLVDEARKTRPKQGAGTTEKVSMSSATPADDMTAAQADAMFDDAVVMDSQDEHFQ